MPSGPGRRWSEPGVGGCKAIGLPQQWLRPADLWMLQVLAESGYSYDSSMRLMLRTYAAEPWRQFPHRTEIAGRPFLEVPLSSLQLLGLHVPIAGGNYFRQFPHPLMRRGVAYWDRHYASPYVMYFHTWELDPDQPRVQGVSLRQQIRQYRNLDKMPAMLRHYLERYRFMSIADFFALDPGPEPIRAGTTLEPEPLVARSGTGLPLAARPADPAVGVTVVVPCYNEEQSLRYLANTLRSVRRRLAGKYDVSYLFVDDASTDGTWQALHTVFADEPACEFVRHEANRGVAAAILTGIARAGSDIVCSIDCDCTYDPHELGVDDPSLGPRGRFGDRVSLPSGWAGQERARSGGSFSPSPSRGCIGSCSASAPHLHELLPGLPAKCRARPPGQPRRLPRSRRATGEAGPGGIGHRGVSRPRWSPASWGARR